MLWLLNILSHNVQWLFVIKKNAPLVKNARDFQQQSSKANQLTFLKDLLHLTDHLTDNANIKLLGSILHFQMQPLKPYLQLIVVPQGSMPSLLLYPLHQVSWQKNR